LQHNYFGPQSHAASAQHALRAQHSSTYLHIIYSFNYQHPTTDRRNSARNDFEMLFQAGFTAAMDLQHPTPVFYI
jgi:hypothetical protein